MSAARIRKFTTITEMEFFLRGGLLGSQAVVPRTGDGARTPGGGILGLVGLTLTLTTPSGTVTFVNATLGANEVRDPAALMFKDIKTQIEGAISGIEVVNIEGRIGIIEATPANGIALDSSDEPARALLGLPNKQEIATKKYNAPGGASPSFEAYNAQQSTHVLFTWE